MYEAIDRSIDGEIKEGRLVPSYSNIALMYGFLWDFAAVHDKRDDWKKQSTDWTESVYSLFKKYDSFFEYNSPTYYGVDLYGLALWRDYGSTERIRKIGSEMESILWKDIASFYEPSASQYLGSLRSLVWHGHGKLCKRCWRLDAIGSGLEDRAVAADCCVDGSCCGCLVCPSHNDPGHADSSGRACEDEEVCRGPPIAQTDYGGAGGDRMDWA